MMTSEEILEFTEEYVRAGEAGKLAELEEELAGKLLGAIVDYTQAHLPELSPIAAIASFLVPRLVIIDTVARLLTKEQLALLQRVVALAAESGPAFNLRFAVSQVEALAGKESAPENTVKH